MRPRTKVPASLLRDLRQFTWDNCNAKLASDLLYFDTDVTPLVSRKPQHQADVLMRVAKVLSRYERRTAKCARDNMEAWLMGSAKPNGTLDGASADVLIHSESAADMRALIARTWRVIDGLVLAARGGKIPDTIRAGGYERAR